MIGPKLLSLIPATKKEYPTLKIFIYSSLSCLRFSVSVFVIADLVLVGSCDVFLASSSQRIRNSVAGQEVVVLDTIAARIDTYFL